MYCLTHASQKHVLQVKLKFTTSACLATYEYRVGINCAPEAKFVLLHCIQVHHRGIISPQEKTCSSHDIGPCKEAHEGCDGGGFDEVAELEQRRFPSIYTRQAQSAK